MFSDMYSTAPGMVNMIPKQNRFPYVKCFVGMVTWKKLVVACAAAEYEGSPHELNDDDDDDDGTEIRSTPIHYDEANIAFW